MRFVSVALCSVYAWRHPRGKRERLFLSWVSVRKQANLTCDIVIPVYHFSQFVRHAMILCQNEYTYRRTSSTFWWECHRVFPRYIHSRSSNRKGTCNPGGLWIIRNFWPTYLVVRSDVYTCIHLYTGWPIYNDQIRHRVTCKEGRNIRGQPRPTSHGRDPTSPDFFWVPPAYVHTVRAINRMRQSNVCGMRRVSRVCHAQ